VWYGLAVLALVFSAGRGVLASFSTVTVPEIDGASLSAGLAATAAGVLVLRARWRSK
jgi:hypothetical protein